MASRINKQQSRHSVESFSLEGLSCCWLDETTKQLQWTPRYCWLSFASWTFCLLSSWRWLCRLKIEISWSRCHGRSALKFSRLFQDKCAALCHCSTDPDLNWTIWSCHGMSRSRNMKLAFECHKHHAEWVGRRRFSVILFHFPFGSRLKAILWISWMFIGDQLLTLHPFILCFPWHLGFMLWPACQSQAELAKIDAFLKDMRDLFDEALWALWSFRRAFKRWNARPGRMTVTAL